MKHTQLILLFFFYISFSVATIGQNYEWTLQDAPIAYANVVEPLDDGSLLLGTQVGHASGWGSLIGRIYLIDGLGEQHSLFGVDFTDGERINIVDISYVDKNAIYVVYDKYGCDFIESRVLTKINNEGEKLWEKNIGSSWDNVYAFGLIGDSTIIAINQNSGKVYDTDGIQTFSFQTTFDVRGLLNISDDTILTYGKQGYAIRAYADTNSVSDYHTNSFFIDAVKLDNEQLVLLNSQTPSWYDFEDVNGLTLLSPEGTVIDSIDFLENEEYTSIASYEDKLFVYGKRDSTLLIKVFNSTLEFETEYEIGFTNITPRDIKQKNGRLFLTGNYNAGYGFDANVADLQIPFGPKGTLWTKVMDINDLSNNERPDVGISNVQIDNFKINSFSDCYPYSNNNIYTSFGSCTYENVALTLTNYGNTTVQEVTINSYINLCYFVCKQYYHITETLENLNLAPENDTIILLGDLASTSIHFGEDATYELCFWTSAPDNKMDANPNNNGYCWVETNIPLGIEDTNIETAINIYPNPTRSKLSISLNEAVLTQDSYIELLNINGQTVLSKPINNTSPALDISGLNNGIYYMRLMQDDRMIYGERVVKMGE